MFTLRTHLAICGALFGALIGVAILGNILQRAGIAPPTGVGRYIAAGLYFALFVAFGLSAVPVILNWCCRRRSREAIRRSGRWRPPSATRTPSAGRCGG